MPGRLAVLAPAPMREGLARGLADLAARHGCRPADFPLHFLEGAEAAAAEPPDALAVVGAGATPGAALAALIREREGAASGGPGAGGPWVRVLVVERLDGGFRAPDDPATTLVLRAPEDRLAPRALALLLALGGLLAADAPERSELLRPSEEQALEGCWLEVQAVAWEDGTEHLRVDRELAALADTLLHPPPSGAPDPADAERIERLRSTLASLPAEVRLAAALPDSLASWAPDTPARKFDGLGETAAGAAERLVREVEAELARLPLEAVQERLDACRQDASRVLGGLARPGEDDAAGPRARFARALGTLERLAAALQRLRPLPADDRDLVAEARRAGEAWVDEERAFLLRALRGPARAATGLLASAAAVVGAGTVALLRLEGEAFAALGPPLSPLRWGWAAVGGLLLAAAVAGGAAAARRARMAAGHRALEGMQRDVERLAHLVGEVRRPLVARMAVALGRDLAAAVAAMRDGLLVAWRGLREHVVAPEVERRRGLVARWEAWCRPGDWMAGREEGETAVREVDRFLATWYGRVLPAVLRYPDPPEAMPVSAHEAVLRTWIDEVCAGGDRASRPPWEDLCRRVGGCTRVALLWGEAGVAGPPEEVRPRGEGSASLPVPLPARLALVLGLTRREPAGGEGA